jgi:hypothetical protein
MGGLGRDTAGVLFARRARNCALLGAVTLALGVFGSSGAQAQPAPVPGCTETELAPLGGTVTAEAAALASTTNSFISVINTMNTAFLAQGSAFVGSPPPCRTRPPGACGFAESAAS